jgi:hypothetical protein
VLLLSSRATREDRGFIWPGKGLFKAGRKKKGIKSVVKKSILRRKVDLIKVGINSSNNLEKANKLIVKLF